jgi:feruloyl esterase
MRRTRTAGRWRYLAGTGIALAGLAALAGVTRGAEPEPVTDRPVFAAVPVTAGDAACAALAGTELPDGDVLSAAMVTAATPLQFLAAEPWAKGLAYAATPLPPFCRVTARMVPVAGSTVHVEVWLPQAAEWNRRFFGTGNGGPGGAISYTGMIGGLRRGFAVANSDLGTSPVSTRATIYPATGRPEAGVDLGHRADHQMTIAAKALIAAYYGQAPQTSIFEGCSTGGQEALAVVQRYPQDYDGVIAGAPANNRTHLHSFFLWNFFVQQAVGGRLSAGKLANVHQREIASCAGRDGGLPTDDFLTDPRMCSFDPATVPQCRPGEEASDSCLTGDELGALRQLYAGPVNSRTGERIFAGVPFGTDWAGILAHGWSGWQDIDSYTWNWTFGTGFDYRSFDFDRHLDQVDANSASYLNSNVADLGPFRRNGGKLLLYTGTADPHIPFPDTLNYYERIVAAMGGDLRAAQGFARYYMVPGMGHCAGGAGFGDFGQAMRVPDGAESDVIGQLVRWVETDVPPALTAQRLSTDGAQVTAERPLCAYPEFPEYQGGDPAKATSFACVPHGRGNVAVPAARYLNTP